MTDGEPKDSGSTNGGTAPTALTEDERQRLGRRQLAATIAATCVVGLAAIAVSPWSGPILYLWAMACTACGSVVGFLLGAPRLGMAKDASGRRSAVASGSVDRLSEWILGAFVGIGLVEARQIGNSLWGLSEVLARGVQHSSFDTPAAQAFALALIVYFLAMGVIGAYLATTLLLTNFTSVLPSPASDDDAVRSE